MLPVPFIILLQEASSEEKYLKMTPTGLISWRYLTTKREIPESKIKKYSVRIY